MSRWLWSRGISLLGVGAIAVSLTSCQVIQSFNPMAPSAQVGDTVKVDYTLRLDDGSVADTSAGKTPLEFTLGAGEVVPGFDRNVTGMKVGESKEFTVTAQDGYGPARPDLVVTLPLDAVETVPKVGETVSLTGPNGISIPAKVVKVSGDGIRVDANHPLAGQSLTFAVELLDILEPNSSGPSTDGSSPPSGTPTAPTEP
jgi:peptidylprolyl isomerase